jgi:HSP20 family molecular chaperone IbpA
VDIREDADHIYVDAELPGFRKEDVQVQLENGTLTILAEHQEELAEPAPQAQQGAQGQTSARDGQGAQGQQNTQGQEGTAQSSEQGRSGQQGQESQQGQQGRQGQQQQREQKGDFLLRERRIQRYVRSFTLPPNVDDRNVEARLENGVLHVTLHKREDSKPKRVNVS